MAIFALWMIAAKITCLPRVFSSRLLCRKRLSRALTLLQHNSRKLPPLDLLKRDQVALSFRRMRNPPSVLATARRGFLLEDRVPWAGMTMQVEGVGRKWM